MNYRTSSLIINGLYIDKKTIVASEESFSYNQLQLKELLHIHKNSIELKMIDDLYLELNTLHVIDYKGKSYVITKTMEM